MRKLYSQNVAPFLIYLFGTLPTEEIIKEGISADWIYTYYRHPNHTALFPNLKYFISNYLMSILGGFFALVITVTFSIYTKYSFKQRILNFFVISSLIGVITLLGLVIFDRTGTYLKYYPFRINTLSAFFFTMLVGIWLEKYFINKKLLSRLFFVFAVFLFIEPIMMNFYRNYYFLKNREKLDEVCEYVKEQTPKNSVIFCFFEDPSVSRKTERNLFSIFKFVPSDLNLIHSWYNRVELKKKIIGNSDILCNNIRIEPKIDFVIAKNGNSFTPDCFQLKFRNQEYSIYELKK